MSIEQQSCLTTMTVAKLTMVPATVSSGGERGIRTPGTREGPTVFKTVAIVRSAIPPPARIAP